MSDLLNLAGVALAAAAVVAALLIYRWQRQRKALSYAVLTNRPLLTADTPFAVTLRHDEEIVTEPRLVVLRVANTGNMPIEADDFEHPFKLTFRSCDVLSVEVTGVHPVGLMPTLRKDGSTVTLDPCLLNPADLIEVQCLLDGGLNEINAECRAVGVRSVREAKLPRDSWGKVWRLSMADAEALALWLIVCVVGAVWSFTQGRAIFLGIASLFMAVAAAGYAVRMVRRNRLWLAFPPPGGH